MNSQQQKHLAIEEQAAVRACEAEFGRVTVDTLKRFVYKHDTEHYMTDPRALDRMRKAELIRLAANVYRIRQLEQEGRDAEVPSLLKIWRGNLEGTMEEMYAGILDDVYGDADAAMAAILAMALGFFTMMNTDDYDAVLQRDASLPAQMRQIWRTFASERGGITTVAHIHAVEQKALQLASQNPADAVVRRILRDMLAVDDY